MFLFGKKSIHEDICLWFLWKSAKQLRSTSKQRKILNLEHCILQVMLHNLHQFLLVGLGQCATWSKRTSATGNAWVGFLLVRIRASDSSSLNWSKDLWFLCGFPFWQKWRRYRIQALTYQWDARISFWYQRFVLPGVWFNDSNISARLMPPMFLLYCWTIWGHGMFFLTFSFPHHLSNSLIGSTPTKFDTRLTTLLSTHFTAIIPELLSQG